jgi:hypothetical protein
MRSGKRPIPSPLKTTLAPKVQRPNPKTYHVSPRPSPSGPSPPNSNGRLPRRHDECEARLSLLMYYTVAHQTCSSELTTATHIGVRSTTDPRRKRDAHRGASFLQPAAACQPAGTARARVCCTGSGSRITVRARPTVRAVAHALLYFGPYLAGERSPFILFYFYFYFSHHSCVAAANDYHGQHATIGWSLAAAEQYRLVAPPKPFWPRSCTVSA